MNRESANESHSTTVSKELTRTIKYSTTLATRMESSLLDLSNEPPEQILRKALSITSIISATSSFATRMQLAASQQESRHREFRIIGLGSCGTVFEIPGTELAYKKGSSEHGIWTDFCLTNKAHNAVITVRTKMQELFPHLAIPTVPLCLNSVRLTMKNSGVRH